MKDFNERLKKDIEYYNQLNRDIPKLKRIITLNETELKKLEDYAKSGEGKLKYVIWAANKNIDSWLIDKLQAKKTIKSMQDILKHFIITLSKYEKEKDDLWDEMNKIHAINMKKDDLERDEIKKEYDELIAGISSKMQAKEIETVPTVKKFIEESEDLPTVKIDLKQLVYKKLLDTNISTEVLKKLSKKERKQNRVWLLSNGLVYAKYFEKEYPNNKATILRYIKAFRKKYINK